jgi:predicted ATPase
MRIKSISVVDILPVKIFQVTNLSDIVVIAGANGVGKTRLIQGILNFFQLPSANGNVKLNIEATCPQERTDWDKQILDTSNQGDVQKLIGTLHKSHRRSEWQSNVINFESDRSITQIQPFNFTWDYQDPWDEMIGWNHCFSGLKGRFQDTLHSIFRKIRSRRESISIRVETLIHENKTKIDKKEITTLIQIDPNEFPDPIDIFKDAFSQLLAPKKLLDADPKNQQLFYELNGEKYAINSLSSGEREVINIVFDFILRKPSDSIVFFDEPELHLHPELSYKLLQTLLTVGVRNQFVFCTHSPDIITASLENSVVFISPPSTSGKNQAILVNEDDTSYQALHLLGQSVGIVALGKKIVLIEGTSSSLDKQTYGAILKNQFPSLVLAPSGGKEIIRSFSTVLNSVLNRTVWGISFYMLCDRDTLPFSNAPEDIEQESKGRLRFLKKYHLENYFLNEIVLSNIFKTMEPPDSWLVSPERIQSQLLQFALKLLSYSTALHISSMIREQIGNVDIMPKMCHERSIDELVELIFIRVNEETIRIQSKFDGATIKDKAYRFYNELKNLLMTGDEKWKNLIPGRPLLHMFASQAQIDPGRLKLLYIKAAEKENNNPFSEIIEVFTHFNSLP